MKKIKRLLSILASLVLVFVMVFSLMSEAIAQTIRTGSVQYISPYGATFDEAEVKSGNIIGEDKSRRDEYTKYFITDAGTTIAAQYGVPVHYKNDDGEYVDFDNSLTSSNATNLETTVDEATIDEISLFSLRNTEVSEDVFSNKKSNSKVSHFKKTGKAKLIEITRNDYTISWGYSGANIVDAREQKCSVEELVGNDAFTTLTNLSSTVLYEDIYNNVDLEVINSTAGVKENLILKAANTMNVFKIEYSIGDLVAESVDSHTIVLKDDETIVYTISAPYMTDAQGEMSEAVELKILQNNKGKLSVKLTADKTWLKDKSRVYPVTVDPTFTYGQRWGQIQSTYVNSGATNTSYTEGSFYVGRPGDNGVRRSLIKIPNLPVLNIGDMVVDAQLVLWQVNNYPTIDMYVGVYESNSDWTDLSSVTWDNQPGFSDNLIDYEKCAAYTYGWRDLDITELVKKWYNGADNNGLYLTMLDESDVYQGLWFSSSLYPTDSTVRPELIITYLNNKGIENYWTYTSLGAGSAGTAHINDYSGNLVFELPLAETHGLSLPMGISYYYNSYYSGKKYAVTSPHTGRGWKMNIQQTVIELPSDSGLREFDYEYVYTDADGTEHYFKRVTEDGAEKLLDEDGLKLELLENSDNTLTIVNEDKCKWNFSQSGLLTSIEDNIGNTATINYSQSNPTTIDSITDGDGKTIYFSLNSSTYKYMLTITDSNNDVTTMGYTGSYLTQVTKPNGTKIYFSYDDKGFLTSVTNVDNSKLCFTYDLYGSKGVTSVQEYATDSTSTSNGTVGQRMTFDRSKYNTTLVQTSGTDCVYGTDDDIITEQQFDNLGRTIAMYNKVASTGEVLGAASAEYTSGTLNSDNSNAKYLNRVIKNYSLGANKENLVNNHSMEKPDPEGVFTFDDWGEASWIANTVEFAVEENTNKDMVLYGDKSMKLSVNSVSGDARGRVYQNIDVKYLEKGAVYTLSAYVRTENLVPIEGAENYGAVVCVTPVDSDASTTDIYAEHVSRNTDPNINKGFRRVSLTFTVPNNSSLTKIRIQLALRGATGTVYFDGIQLEKGDAASTYNLMENGSFERGETYEVPEGWLGTDTVLTFDEDGDKNSTDDHIDGDCSFKLKGDTGKNKYIWQDIPLDSDVTEFDTYILSGWAKGNAVPKETNGSSFRLIARVYFVGGGSKEYNAFFNTTLDDSQWQYACKAFPLSDGTDTEKKPDFIRVFIAYNKQGDSACFDNIQLTKEAVTTYTYDKEGNVESVIDSATQRSELTFDDGLLNNYILPNDFEYTYEYDDNRQLETATTSKGTEYNFGYDTKGNMTSMAVDTTDNLHMLAEATYPVISASTVNYTVSSTNQDGETYTSVYNANTGNVVSETDFAGNTVSYTYDENDVLSGISQGTQSVTYDYNNSYTHLDTITHGGTTYNFGYDIFGNRETVAVGTRNLATYTYAQNNGYLQSMTYGNGSTVSYIYDIHGNVSEAKRGNDTVVIKNFADSIGNIIRTQDLIANLEHRISYDYIGRPISKEVLDLTVTGNHDKWLRSVEYSYDVSNNLDKFTYADSDGSNVTTYTYTEDNLPYTATLNNGNVLTYTHDNLGRVIGKSLVIDEDTYLDSVYTYHVSARGTATVDGVTKTYTTTKLEKEETPAFGYKYDYDVLGNITGIYIGVKGTYGKYTYNSTPDIEYVYDSYGQLTYVNDYVNGEQYEYVYNSAGNITRRYHYAMNDSWVPSATLESIRYTYADTNGWKDLLTKYNGQTITYDAIGNPLGYRDGITLTWQNGRELATYKNDSDGTEVTYTYDANGMRTKKAVTDVVTTEYVYENGKLQKMEYAGYLFDFSYDANGNPIGFKFCQRNSTDEDEYYYYGTNYRGDIIALYDSDGTQVASYTYDAYGKPTNTTELVSGHHTAIAVNPLRYRGYVYDKETGFYYLQSRYYDPTTCRFLNADVYYDTGVGFTGLNMFAYCNNNPVIFSDHSGEIVTYSGVTYNGVKFHNVPAHQLGWYGQIKEYGIDSVVYDVPLYDQGSTNLCWAYSQAMIEDYKSNIERTPRQAKRRAKEIAREKYGFWDWNQGGYPKNLSDGYYDDISHIGWMLYNYGPLYASYGYYIDEQRKSGHAIVITGVDLYSGIIYTNNPWGVSGTQSYNEFITNFIDNEEAGWRLDGYGYLY